MASVSRNIGFQKSVEIIFTILAGFVIVELLRSSRSFILYLQRSVNMPEETIATAVVVAYFLYVVNVFRQVYGLADVFTSALRGTSKSKLTQLLQFFILILSFSILFLNVLLVSHIESSARDYFSAEIRTIYIAYFVTMLAFTAWDIITLKYFVEPDGEHRIWRIVKSKYRTLSKASDYQEWSVNWLLLNLFTILLVSVFFFTRYIGFQFFQAPSMDLWFLIFVTGAYTVGDLILNRNFYFPIDQESRKTSAFNKLLVFASIILLFGTLIYFLKLPSIREPEKITLQLKWTINAGYAGDLVAKEKKYWKQRKLWETKGLNVTIKEGKKVDHINEVVSGNAQIGVTTGDRFLLAVSKGKPIIAIALIYQNNPLAWIVKDRSRIQDAADLRGKKVGLTYIDDEPLFKAMMRNAGLNPVEDLEVIRVGSDYKPFVEEKVDAFPVFRNTQGVEIAAGLGDWREIGTHFIAPSDSRIISYSNLYFVHKDFLEKKKDIVRQFIYGVLRAWEYVQENEDEAAAIVVKYSKVFSPNLAKESIIETNRLVKPSKDTKIGHMSESGWESTLQFLVESEQISVNIDLKEIYTNEFVIEYYEKH